MAYVTGGSMKIFILWVMLTSGKGVALESHEYNSLDACTAAELQLNQSFTRSQNWTEYAVQVVSSCTEK